MEIPYQQLSPAALRGVIEDFVLREGTDYGHHNYTLEDKVEKVQQQLEHGQAKIMYDSQLDTCTILVVSS